MWPWEDWGEMRDWKAREYLQYGLVIMLMMMMLLLFFSSVEVEICSSWHFSHRTTVLDDIIADADVDAETMKPWNCLWCCCYCSLMPNDRFTHCVEYRDEMKYVYWAWHVLSTNTLTHFHSIRCSSLHSTAAPVLQFQQSEEIQMLKL